MNTDVDEDTIARLNEAFNGVTYRREPSQLTRLSIPTRLHRRKTLMVVASVCAAAAAVVAVLVPGSGGSQRAVAWAASPDEVSSIAAETVDAVCSAASGLTLPTASNIDLRGTAGAALYETGDTWQVCTFLRDGDDASFAEVVSVAALQRPTDLPDDAEGVMRVQTAEASVDGTPIIVATGKCFDPMCPGAVTLATEAGQGTATISAGGTFVVWAPAGSTLTVAMQ